MAKDKKRPRQVTTDAALDRVFGKHAARRLRDAVAALDRNANADGKTRKGKKKKKDKEKRKDKDRKKRKK